MTKLDPAKVAQVRDEMDKTYGKKLRELGWTDKVVKDILDRAVEKVIRDWKD